MKNSCRSLSSAHASSKWVIPAPTGQMSSAPLINDKQAAQVKAQIEDAVAKGAKVELGGGVNGRFVEQQS